MRPLIIDPIEVQIAAEEFVEKLGALNIRFAAENLQNVTDSSDVVRYLKLALRKAKKP